MQLNVTTDYAIRTVLYLGQCKKLASATEISKEMQIPKGDLEKVLSKLKKAEYISSDLGVRDGYHLNMTLEEITLGDVIRLMENTTKINRCLEEDMFCNRKAVDYCAVRRYYATSLPVGGESTHTVLTGHRGLPSKLLFTDLDELEEGDIFYIKILGETLAYQIDQILTVKPENTKALTIAPGKDYVTLVTCTPYAVNTHRLLVRGKRIPYEEAIRQVPDEKIIPKLPLQVKILLLAIGILLLVFVIYKVSRKTGKRKEMRRKRR